MLDNYGVLLDDLWFQSCCKSALAPGRRTMVGACLGPPTIFVFEVIFLKLFCFVSSTGRSTAGCRGRAAPGAAPV